LPSGGTEVSALAIVRLSLAVIEEILAEGRLQSVEPVSTIKQIRLGSVLAFLPKDDRGLETVLLDVLAERPQFVGRQHREKISRRVDRQHVAPGLAHCAPP